MFSFDIIPMAEYCTLFGWAGSSIVVIFWYYTRSASSFLLSHLGSSIHISKSNTGISAICCRWRLKPSLLAYGYVATVTPRTLCNSVCSSLKYIPKWHKIRPSNNHKGCDFLWSSKIKQNTKVNKWCLFWSLP